MRALVRAHVIEIKAGGRRTQQRRRVLLSDDLSKT